jgi:hypothetical protein
MSSENIFVDVASSIQKAIGFLKLKDLKKLCENVVSSTSQIKDMMFDFFLLLLYELFL